MPGSVILFASEYGRRDLSLPGVQRVMLGTPKNLKRPEPASALKTAEYDFSMAYSRGKMTSNDLLLLRETGFIPDMICATSAMGNSLFLRDVFPESFLVVHAEEYVRHGRTPNTRTLLNRAPELVRNLLHLNGLVDCDLATTSTEWQQRQFPEWFARDMLVLPRCVDTDFFSPEPNAEKSGQEIVTFSGRGLETSQGLPRLLECLSMLLEARPSCQVAILASGVEKTRLPWLQKHLLMELGGKAERVQLCGFSVPEHYRLLLRASSLHVYWNTSAMLPSGLFECMSCGCLVLASDTEAVREAIQEGENGFLCMAYSSESLVSRIVDLLERAPTLMSVREAARKTVLERYSLGYANRDNRDHLLERYEKWRKGGHTA